MDMLNEFILVRGHRSKAKEIKEGCIMDVVSLIIDPSREFATDILLPCVCPVVREYAIELNDASWKTDNARTAALLPLAERIAKSRSTSEVEMKRFRLMFNGLAREDLSELLELAGLPGYAGELRSLPKDAGFDKFSSITIGLWKMLLASGIPWVKGVVRFKLTSALRSMHNAVDQTRPGNFRTLSMAAEWCSYGSVKVHEAGIEGVLERCAKRLEAALDITE